MALASRTGKSWTAGLPKIFSQEMGVKCSAIVLETVASHVFGRMLQAPLRLGEPLGNLASLAVSFRSEQFCLRSSRTPTMGISI
jgi:hypothetical protein